MPNYYNLIPKPLSIMRDNRWLAERLKIIWEKYFPEVEQKNDVIVKFGKKSRRTLGSIRLQHENPSLLYVLSRRALGVRPKTIIVLNGHFKKRSIPEYVIDATIAHELSHYAHGFASPHKQKYHYPHKHGVVRAEMRERGLLELLQKKKQWTKANWQ